MADDPIRRLNTALEGRYRVERQLGEGGMATVYLALDEKHGRHVALKVLKPEIAAAIGSERFLKEIEVTAKLHHPHILPLHDSGEASGFLYYVMPYVDGEALSERIHRERELPVDESLGITKDLAEALDYAHRQGVVHRDIKPSNVLLQDGQPVIADFGIALAVTAAAGDRLTATGLSIGTPLYMSPEQAAADRPVDRRSDVYALACILFEMLSGEPPFAGSNPGALLARKLTDTAPDLSTLRDTVSWAVAQAVKRALSRTPADRFQTAADFARALGDGAEPATASDAGPGAGAPGLRSSSRRTPWGLVFGSVVVGALAGGVATGKLSSVEDRTPAVELSIPLGDLQLQGANWPVVDISPDGSLVAFLAADSVDRRLYLQPLAGPARLVADSEGAMSPTFSPDGRFVAYFTRDAVWRLDVTQGSPVRVQSSSGPILGATWTDDDRLIYSRGYRGGLSWIPVGGGAVTDLSELDTLEASHRLARAVPGTTYVLVTRRGGPEAGIWMLDTATGDWHRLTEGNGAQYVDEILFFDRDETLYGQRLDLDAVRLIGDPVPLLDGVNHHHAISETGTLVQLAGQEAPLERLMLVDLATGAQTAIRSEPANYTAPTISRDGTRVSVGVSTSEGLEQRVYELSTGAEEVLGPVASLQALWSPDPDSSALVYVRPDLQGRPLIRTDLSSGDPPLELFPDTWGTITPMAWSRAGILVFSAVELENDGVLLAYRNGAFEPLRQTPAVTWGADLSPADDRVVFAEGPANGDLRIHVTQRSFPDMRGLITISGYGAGGPRWAPDGRSVYFYEGSELVQVPFDSDGNPRPDQRRVILDRGWPGNPVTPPSRSTPPDGRSWSRCRSRPRSPGSWSGPGGWTAYET